MAKAKPAKGRKRFTSQLGGSLSDTWFGRLLKDSRALVLMVGSYFVAVGAATKYFMRDFEALHTGYPSLFWLLMVGPPVFIAVFYSVPKFIETRRARSRT